MVNCFMNEAKRKEINQWLIKSMHDLGSARRLLEGEEKYLDNAVYHCQQAAEKAIKAFLTYKDIVFEKTHNPIALLSLCLPSESSFAQFKKETEILTPYATEFRYPGDVLEPDMSEVKQALEMSESIVNFIIDLIPDYVKYNK